jgi:diguanylate cyclase (GGDEF)-like protein
LLGEIVSDAMSPERNGPASIVLVDDIPTNVMLLNALVQRVGNVATHGFTDPIEAVRWCESNQPDLVLLDYVMPGMDGIQVLRAIRSLAHMATVPVVMVTGSSEDLDSRHRALEAGANDFITKPVDEIELIARCRNMLLLRSNARALYRLATTDELTGLANRRHFFSRLTEEIARAARYPNQPMSLAIADLDHFKSVNDRYGHATGDKVLELVATVSRSCFRKIDTVGRVGGEEFGLLLPTTSIDGAEAVCERFRQAIASSSVEHEGRAIRVTVSIGVVEHQEFDDTSLLYRHADKALYRAKESGRNRTEIGSRQT